MMDYVDTGVITEGGVYVDSLSGEYNFRVVESDDDTPLERVVYPTNARALIVVNVNEMVVFTAYDLLDGEEVFINKILRSRGFPDTSDSSCCPVVNRVNAIKLRSVYTGWKLTKNKPIFVLKTPGEYELEMISSDGGGISDLVVTASTYGSCDVNVY